MKYNLSPYNQTVFVMWGNYLIFSLFMFLDFHWWMIPAIFVMMHLFGIMSEVSVHRYWTHKSYEAPDWMVPLLKFASLLTGQGAIISWVTVHRHHHLYEDKPGDPHAPLYVKWWKIFLGLLPTDYKKTVVSDLIRRPDRKYFIFEVQYYWMMWMAIWSVSYLIHPYLLFAIATGGAFWYIGTSIVNILSHGLYLGKVTYKKDVATDSVFLQWLVGAGYHNSHHAQPTSYRYNLDGTRFDHIGWLIKHVLAKNGKELT